MPTLIITDSLPFKVFLVSKETCSYSIFSSANLNNIHIQNVTTKMDGYNLGYKLPSHLFRTTSEKLLIDYIERGFNLTVISCKDYIEVEDLIEDLKKFIISEELAK